MVGTTFYRVYRSLYTAKSRYFTFGRFISPYLPPQTLRKLERNLEKRRSYLYTLNQRQQRRWCGNHINCVPRCINKLHLKMCAIILKNDSTFRAGRNPSKIFSESYYIQFLHLYPSFLSGYTVNCKSSATDIDFCFRVMYNVYGLSGVLWHITLAPSSYWRSCSVFFFSEYLLLKSLFYSISSIVIS